MVRCRGTSPLCLILSSQRLFQQILHKSSCVTPFHVGCWVFSCEKSRRGGLRGNGPARTTNQNVHSIYSSTSLAANITFLLHLQGRWHRNHKQMTLRHFKCRFWAPTKTWDDLYHKVLSSSCSSWAGQTWWVWLPSPVLMCFSPVCLLWFWPGTQDADTSPGTLQHVRPPLIGTHISNHNPKANSSVPLSFVTKKTDRGEWFTSLNSTQWESKHSTWLG